MLGVHRDLAKTTPSGGREMTFYHPTMQETLIEAARSAGAEIWRDALVVAVCPGDPPMVTDRAHGRQSMTTS